METLALVKEAREELKDVPGIELAPLHIIIPMMLKTAQQEGGEEIDDGGAIPFYRINEAAREAELEGGGRMANPYSIGAGGISGILGALVGGAIGGGRGAVAGGLLLGVLGFLAQKMGWLPDSFQNMIGDFANWANQDPDEAVDKVRNSAAEGFKKLPEDQKAAVVRKAFENGTYNPEHFGWVQKNREAYPELAAAVDEYEHNAAIAAELIRSPRAPEVRTDAEIAAEVMAEAARRRGINQADDAGIPDTPDASADLPATPQEEWMQERQAAPIEAPAAPEVSVPSFGNNIPIGQAARQTPAAPQMMTTQSDPFGRVATPMPVGDLEIEDAVPGAPSYPLAGVAPSSPAEKSIASIPESIRNFRAGPAAPFRDRPASVQAAQRAAAEKQLAAAEQVRKQPPSRESFITKFHDPVQLGQGLYETKKAVTEMPGHLSEALRREQEHISGLANTVKTDAGRTLEKGRQVAKQLGDTVKTTAGRTLEKGGQVAKQLGDTGRQMAESASKKVDKGIDYVGSVRSAYNQAKLRDEYGRRK